MDTQGRPGSIAASHEPFETTTLDFEEAPCLCQCRGEQGFGKPCQFGGELGFPVPRFPCALHEKKEDATVPSPAMAPGGWLGVWGLTPGRDGIGLVILPFPLGLGREVQGTFAGHIAFAGALFVAAGASSDKSQTRSDIALKAGTLFLVAIEEGGDSLAMRKEGIGRFVDIVETETAWILI
ncbi:MAG TPA: hypothetical protein VMV44_04690 [Rectinemataceae bacterium]|nr:hypothetical protein [Rectinemataceae bacterium]